MNLQERKGSNPGWAMLSLSVLIAGCSFSPKAVLELKPSVARECDTPVATSVYWDVSPLGLKKATLEISDVGAPSKFWHAGDERGTAEAPAWARDGYTVTLLSANGVVLARRTLTTIACE